jgi:hypothetical protein
MMPGCLKSVKYLEMKILNRYAGFYPGSGRELAPATGA